MSIALTTVNETFDSSSQNVPSMFRPIDELIEEVADVIAPVWPLKDYVAVNPYFGIANRSFIDARSFMKVFSDCEMLMPIEHYAAEFNRGEFTVSDIESAIAELSTSGVSLPLSLTLSSDN